jgi:hypothetical protein
VETFVEFLPRASSLQRARPARRRFKYDSARGFTDLPKPCPAGVLPHHNSGLR